MSPVPTTLGQRLKALRKERGLTQAVVADAVGIQRPSLSMIEVGRDVPGRETLFALATYYKVSADYLRTGTPAPSQKGLSESVDDLDELAWLRLWRQLERDERVVLLRRLGASLDYAKAG